MTGRLCLDCIWAISSDSVALFVSHCDKVLWLSIIIPSRSEGSFPNSIFQLSRSYSRHKKCMEKKNKKQNSSTVGLCIYFWNNLLCVLSQRRKQEALSCYPTCHWQMHSGTPAINSHLATVQFCSIVCKVIIFWDSTVHDMASACRFALDYGTKIVILHAACW